jgi:colicin import membrane protein
MARKLKTYTTSAGFFDLAIAAPSMKAALEAWGSKINLFHHGFAKVSADPDIVAATMAKPGIILRRPVGTDAAFSEHAELPSSLAGGRQPPAKTVPKKVRPPAKPLDQKASRQAALAFEREQERRERQSRKEEAAAERHRRHRERAVVAAESALQEAEQAHQKTVSDLDKERAALDRKLEAEEARWKKKREQLDSALRKARS